MTRKKKRILIITIIVAFIAVAGLVYWFVLKDKSDNKTEPQAVYYSQLTGKEVTEDQSKVPILGAMIENSEEARPQTGLSSAGIVFEAVTEGGITRYLALYQENPSETIGPVRSVRSHFVDWFMGFDAAIAHVGGSEAALALMQERGAKDLDQFKYPEPYYRDENRVPPHNMYARTADLFNLQKQLDYTTSIFEAISRSNDAPNSTPNPTSVTVEFSGPQFTAEFRYDQTTNTYLRFLAGEPHVDAATNQQISVKNVVVMKADPVENGVQAIGGGEVLVFKDGNIITGTWQQKDYESRVTFYDSQNNQIPLNRGNTWIMAVDKNRSVTY